MSEATGEAPKKKRKKKAWPPGRTQGKAAKAMKKRAAPRRTTNGADGHTVTSEERAAAIAQLVAIEDDAEYDARVRQEARRIGVKVPTIDMRRKAYQKAERERLQAEAEARRREEEGFDLESQPPPGARPKRKPDADGVIWPWHFTMKEDGLWCQPQPRNGGSEPEPVWIAARFQVVAETSDDTHHSHGLLLSWTDRNLHDHKWAMPRRMVHLEGNAIAVELEDAGLACAVSRTAHDELKRFLGAVGSIHRVRCVERAGWHGTSYVMPNGTVFAANDSSELVLQSEHAATADAYAVRGNLEQWQEHVARPAAGNDLLIFALSASFAGPLLEVMGETSGGVHLSGGSQTGKTTLLCTAASVWGPGDNKTGPIRSWRGTANGLEAVAAECSDGLLALDEIGQASAKEVGDVVYMLANQRGKARMQRAGGTRRPMTWRLIYLSTGEVTLAAKMGDAGLRTHAGQEIRLLNLSADAGVGHGVFHKLHGAASAGAFADRLRHASVTFCGTAGPAFLEALVQARADDVEKLKRVLRDACEQFVDEYLPKGADGQVRSAALRFALISTAGELAHAYDVVPWPEGEATKAAAACFKSWLAARGSEGAAEDQQAIDLLRLFISKHGASRFEDLDRKTTEQTQNMDATYPDPMGGSGSRQLFEQKIIERAGYVRKIGDSQEFLILASVWRDEIFKGMDAARAAHALQKADLLVPGKQNTSTVEWIPGTGSARVYVIRSTILG
jgi:uncharacterized protein (DUF927 family)